MMTVATPNVQEGIQYANDVVDGVIVACNYVKLACQRTLDDLDRANSGDGEWEFRADLAEKVIKFCQLLPNIKGPLANKPLCLLPWQKYVIANLFGFVSRGTDTRRFRQATIFACRGQGKTTLMAPLAIYMTFIEGEGGAASYAAAVTRDQAGILWGDAWQMLHQTPKLRERFGIELTKKSIHQLKTASKFVAISSDAKSLEGLSVHCAILDEIASHHTDAVYTAISTATGKRKHPMLICISTATGNNTGIGKQLWDYAAKIVNGDQEDDRHFSLLYTIDDDDDPWSEDTWIKANPSWGVSVQPDALRGMFNQARNNPAREAAVFTRHLNRWVGADEQLFSTRAWRNCADPSLDLNNFLGRKCHIGLDLAHRQDIAGLVLCFPEVINGKAHYTLFCKAYLNEDAVLQSRNQYYAGWAASGRLIITPGNETDFDAIEEDVIQLTKKFKVMTVAADPWNATQMIQHLAAEGIEAVEFRMTTQNLSAPTQELGAAMVAGRVHHDGDEVLAWNIGNVVGQEDRNGNVFPTKQHRQAKNDLAVAAIMGIGRSMLYEDTSASIYEKRPMLILG